MTLSGEVPPGSAERLVLSPQASITAEVRRQVIVSQAHSAALQNAAAYALSPWPVVSVEAAEGWLLEAPVTSALNLDQLKQQIRQHPGALSAAATDELNTWQRRLAALDAPLPLALRRDISYYLRHAGALLPDEETALGFAAAAFVLPYALSKGVTADALSELFSGRPEVLRLL